MRALHVLRKRRTHVMHGPNHVRLFFQKKRASSVLQASKAQGRITLSGPSSSAPWLTKTSNSEFPAQNKRRNSPARESFERRGRPSVARLSPASGDYFKMTPPPSSSSIPFRSGCASSCCDTAVRVNSSAARGVKIRIRVSCCDQDDSGCPACRDAPTRTAPGRRRRRPRGNVVGTV